MPIVAFWFGIFLASLVCSGVGWSQTLTRLQVSTSLNEQLPPLFLASGTGLSLRSLFCRTKLELSEGVVSWELSSDLEQLQPGRQNLDVVALLDGIPSKRLTVSVVLNQTLRTPVLRHSIRRGDIILAGDLRMEEVHLTRPVPDRVERSQEIIGLAASRTIREDQPLRYNWFEQPMAVQRGDKVRIKLTRGGLTLETSGIALGKGRVGDMISLRNPDSKRTYEAQIVAPGRAEIQAW